MKAYGAEFFGTFWLVLGGCGSAVLAAAFPGLGIGFAGVALAFGLTVLTMAYAVGHISGGHFNPAVSVGLVVGGRFSASKLVPYVVAQVLEVGADLLPHPQLRCFHLFAHAVHSLAHFGLAIFMVGESDVIGKEHKADRR